MAEFTEVCKQWRRMCDSFGDKACQSYRPCAEQCPVGANPVCGELRESTPDDIERFEAAVMAWAAEHPIVYPTWAEFLHEAFCERYPMPYMGDAAWYAFLRETHIPADIAQKLGLEQKGET